MHFLSWALLASSLTLAYARTDNEARYGGDSRSSKFVSAAWYAGWHAEDFPLDIVSWGKFTHMYYSFAVPTNDVTNITLDGSEADVLPKFVETARKNGVKPMVSLGGWAGSQYFSTAVADPWNRTLFANSIVGFALKNKLDGIDFDWEYPGTQGIGCNTISPNDTANFLIFLKQLRRHPLAQHLILTAATSLFPWSDENEEPLTDVSEFARVFDWINIMNYDVWGPWTPTVGPNGPLNDTCASEDNQMGSAVSGVQQWMDAGMPAHKIVLGVPLYGHKFNVNSTSALDENKALNPYAAYVADSVPQGDKWDTNGTDACGVDAGYSGQVNIWGMIDQGFLWPNGTVRPDIYSAWDDCSQTPFVYNATTNELVAYDNVPSFKAKGKFIKDNKLRGFAMWEAGGDYQDLLLDAIREASGCSSE